MTDSNESVQSTYEEATRCPKCGNPGDVTSKVPAPRQANLPLGTQIHTVYCRSELCPWLNTCWMVQVNKDGSVPPPTNHTGQAKVYQGFEGHDEEAKRVVESLRREAAAQTQPGTEVRNPFSR